MESRLPPYLRELAILATVPGANGSLPSQPIASQSSAGFHGRMRGREVLGGLWLLPRLPFFRLVPSEAVRGAALLVGVNGG